jgi:hypothetical protein
MAYRKNFLEEEAQKNVAQGASVGQNTLSPRSTTDQTAAIEPGQATGAGAGANAPQTGPSPTGYIPLQQYLQANVGAGAGVKNVLGGQVEKAKAAAEQEISRAQTEAETKAKETATAYQQKGQEIAGGIAKAPVESIDKAKEFLEQAYAGPEAGTYTAQIGAAKTGAQQALTGLETEAGKQAALEKGLKGYGRYGAIDRYLFAQDPAAKAAFEAERAKAKEAVQTKAGTAETAVGEQIKTAQDKLIEQQKAIQKTAKDEMDYKNYLKVQEKLAKNQAIDKQLQDYREASLGDVTSQQELADLEALAAISGEDLSEGYRKKTYKAGRAKTDRPLKMASKKPLKIQKPYDYGGA